MADAVTLLLGDNRELLGGLADASVDAVVTDPPYALASIVKRFGSSTAAPTRNPIYARGSAGFMGQKWDTGETAFSAEFWAEVRRVLKPGGHLVALGGTRTYHRLACAIEDAGFEIRDMVAWLYGSGFPKSHNVGRAVGRAGGEDAQDWAGWGTALKPALEPVVLARNPLVGGVAANVMAHGVGGLHVDACRVGESKDVPASPSRGGQWYGGNGESGAEGGHNPDLGRWPANVAHDGSPEVVASFPAEAGAFAPVHGTEPSNAVGYVFGRRTRVATVHHGDGGSAARFFYSAKADAVDRMGSRHPTVKPVDLMAWLIRLVTPPGGLVLDPFAGTGTTGVAALGHGFRAILMEREPAYVADARARLDHAQGRGAHGGQMKARRKDQLGPGALFDEVG